MPQLFLKFTDENGTTQRIEVDRDRFIIGRHTANDLSISNPKLSREHAEITRSGDSFYVDDLGSSNGTRLNTYNVKQPEAIYDHDILDLGGGIEISVEIDINSFASLSNPDPGHPSDDLGNDEFGAGSSKPDPVPAAAPQPSGAEGFEFGKLFLIAPLLLVFVLIFAGGAVLLLKGTQNQTVRENIDDEYLPTPRDEESDGNEKDPPENKTPESNTNVRSDPIDNPANTDNPESTDIPVPQGTTEPTGQSGSAVTLEKAAVSFMRRIARNDPSPIITRGQVSEIEAKINQVKNSAALASNIKNAQTNSAAITALAGSKNLKPQFLATAAIAKLGSNSGNVLATAQGMVDVLDKLNIQIGDAFADDGLILIAAYQQGVSDEFLKMRNTMERLAAVNPNVSSRQIRTIWFLRDQGKISSSEFEFALRFLAIGTITQNPKTFGVNAEALSL